MLPAKVCHKRILVVEDNFVLSEVLSTLLGADGYRVWTADNGQEALEYLRGKEPPDLILLDLPVKDGRALQNERKQNARLAAIPVVIVSGAGDLREQAAALVAAEYLPKPVDASLLLQTVHRHCHD
jgi:CheY-like chemotaxis protein